MQADNICQSLAPYLTEDSRKGRYLAYRSSGFIQSEAIKYAGTSTRSLERWRLEDPAFKELEQSLLNPELRRRLSNEFTRSDFVRNYRLILEKDFRIIQRAIKLEMLNDQDFQYLLKIRPHYTPQQLQAIEELLDNKEEITSFSQLVITLSRKEVNNVSITQEQRPREDYKVLEAGEPINASEAEGSYCSEPS